LDVTVVTGRSY